MSDRERERKREIRNREWNVGISNRCGTIVIAPGTNERGGGRCFDIKYREKRRRSRNNNARRRNGYARRDGGEADKTGKRKSDGKKRTTEGPCVVRKAR